MRNKCKLSLFFPFFFIFFFSFSAKSSRKLTFLYLANDVIQNSKRKGPEFTREFESVLVDAFSHVARYVAVFLQLFLSRDLHSCYSKLNSVGFCCFVKSRECLFPVCSRDWILTALWLGSVQCKRATLCVSQPFTASRVCSLCAPVMHFISIVA